MDGAFLKAAALLVTTDLENRSGYGARTTRLARSLARSFLSSPPLLLLLLLLPLRLRVCIACQRGPVRSFVRSKQSNRASRNTTTRHTHITTTGPGKKFGPICDNW